MSDPSMDQPSTVGSSGEQAVPPSAVDERLRALLPDKKIKGWEDVSKLVEFFSIYNGHDWLFRGVTDCDDKLIPSIGPHDRKKKKGSGGVWRPIPYSRTDEEAILQMFKDQSSPYLVFTPNPEIEWLALAQHHGMPTRLLDWTEGLLVAT